MVATTVYYSLEGLRRSEAQLHKEERTTPMSAHIYKLIELAGSSPNSIEEAIANAIHRASKTVHNLQWFEVVETRGQIENGQIAHYQVVLKVGFTLEQ